MEELGAWCDSIPHFHGTTDHLCEYQVISQTLLVLVCMIGFVGNGLSIPVIVQHLRHISKLRYNLFITHILDCIHEIS